jgi:dCTP diphosphatase
MDSFEEEKKKIEQFVFERDWDQFHSPANLAKSISIESGELLECFQWDEKHYDKQAIQEELADVMIYCFQMGIAMDFDLKKIIEEKMAKNAIKYPVSKAKGNARKYNKL